MGATGDGHTNDALAIQKAIDECSGAANGTVHFAPGTYLSGPLTLKSHLRLQFENGAELLGSSDMALYPIRQDAPWRRVSLLHADGVIDLTIAGPGVIDGGGQVWWDAQRANRSKGVPENQRPMLIDLTKSRNVLIEGVTIQNSPQYNILAVLCDGLTVKNVRILNPGKTAPNTDGIDPVSSSHVLIDHDLIDTGDDNVAIKSGLAERGDPDVPSTDITIRDCDFRNGHGLSIGSETLGGVRNVTVERVTFDGTRQGVRIKSARGRGNDIGDFVFRDLTMKNVETPIQITAYYTGGMKDDTAHPLTGHTPRFHNIRIENLKAVDAKFAGQIFGLPESPIRDLTLENVTIAAQQGISAQYADITAKALDIHVASGNPILEGPGVHIARK